MSERSRWLGLVAGLLGLMLLLSAPGLASAGAPLDTSKLDAALADALQAQPNGTFQVIIEVGFPSEQAAASTGASRAQLARKLLESNGGRIQHSLPIIGGGNGEASADAIAKLSRNPFVRQISLDRVVRAADLGPSTASVYAQLVRAPEVWAMGYTGRGVGVAIVDSGVQPSNDLAGRLLTQVDLVDAKSPGGDPGGHGTHVAGIVGGNGADSLANVGGVYKGIAPGANIVSVRVINESGAATLSSVIRGIQWVVNNRKTYNIRVMNLSFGAPAVTSYKKDPMVTAAEIAWLSGIVVVSAAGNAGPGPSTIHTPGIDPYSITVGALDDNMTADASDDVVASFSSRGPTIDKISKPDLVAPGRRIVSLFGPRSFLANLLPDRIMPTTNGSNYFRLSGTSQATPVVAGVAALLLERNPSLKPDQIKFILKKSARALPSIDKDIAGRGVVDALAAVTLSMLDRENKGGRPSDNFANNILPLIKGSQPLTWKDPNLGGRNWASMTWDNLTWDNLTWDNLNWDNLTWDNLSWDNLTWDNLTWDTTWSSSEWDSVPWQSAAGLD